jgi:hypothetical protein
MAGGLVNVDRTVSIKVSVVAFANVLAVIAIAADAGQFCQFP